MSGHMSGHVGTRRDTIRDLSNLVEIRDLNCRLCINLSKYKKTYFDAEIN